MIGQTISHYKILEKLGEGGMGVVYKAQDTKLLRSVALKFLTPDMTRDQDAKRRFIHEARAASALDHPNIAVVHEIDETADGRSFICMAYIEGKTLKEKIAGGPLPIQEAVRTVLQIADGLERAHESGIVHRDIKPGNILLTGRGDVKIVDFGLAKLAAQSRASRTGPTAGTAAYMSPEQIMGSEADARSDLFSLGVLSYEAITGKRPFIGEHEPALFYSIVNAEPARPTTIRPDIPEELERIMLRLLEKDPKKRYQSATDVRADLKQFLGEQPTPRPVKKLRKALRDRFTVPFLASAVVVVAAAILLATGVLQQWFGGPRVSGTQYIGVLPFRLIGGDSTQQVLCDGIFESVVSGLTRMQAILRGSQVCPASETRKYKDVREARKGSGITVAIEGSLQWLPDQIRATVTLVDAERLSSIDSRKVNVSRAEFLDLETKLVSSIADMIGSSPTSAEILRLRLGFTKDQKAYDPYIRARAELAEYTRAERLANAIHFFQQAIRADSLFTLAYAGLGEAYWRKFDATKDVQWADSAIAACAQAQSLDKGLSEVHFTLGLIYHGRGRDSVAIVEYQSILANDPLNANAYMELGEAYATSKQPAKAEVAYKKAIELRNADWRTHHYLARFYYRAKRDSEAVEVWNNATRLAPNQALIHNGLGSAFFRQEHWTDAIEQFNLALQSDSLRYSVYSNLGTAYYYDGMLERAAQSYEKSLKSIKTDYRVWGGLGAAYRELGSKKLAQEAFATAARLAQGQLKVNPTDPEVISQLAGYYADLGRKAEAQAMIRKALLLAPKDGNVLERAVSTFELLGDRAQAFKWLSEALAQGAKITEIKWSPEMKSLREDPRYKQLTQGGEPRQKKN